MFNPIVLKSENQLNKLLRQQKRTGQELNILFYSLWDSYGTDLVDTINSRFMGDCALKPLYLVNTFDMPHSTVIFRSTKLPHLVKLNKRKMFSEDYLPRVYKSLGLGSTKS